MKINLKIYSIDSKYINYLYKFDKKVIINDKNRKRPFIGVLISQDSFEYFAPISSGKIKHQYMSDEQIDLFKIVDKEKVIGVINLNNMIPVPKECLQELLPTINDEKYKKLIEKELSYINDNKYKLIKKANNYYKRYTNNFLNTKQMSRTCNYKLLETKSKEYH